MKNEHRTRVQTARTRGNKGAASETGVVESNESLPLVARVYVEEKTSFSLSLFATFDFEGDTLFIYFFFSLKCAPILHSTLTR